MPIASMTAFARVEGNASDVAYVWELRSVNGKGLEVRLRLPTGLEGIEAEVRRRAAAAFSRGNIQASLQFRRGEETPVFSINRAMLDQLVRLSAELVREGHTTLPTADGLLSLKGIIDVADADAVPDVPAERERAILEGFSEAVNRLTAGRRDEGAAIAGILEGRLAAVERLLDQAEQDPSRTMDAIRQRLERQVGELLGAASVLDPQRLHAEAALLATRADIREELDRLRAHVGAARELLAQDGPVGRRLDFLSQEFNREANTICSKSNATSLTAIGVELKVVIDQFREQVQNVE